MTSRQMYTTSVGQAGQFPALYRLTTDESFGTITTAEYLNSFVQEGFNFSNGDFILVNYNSGVNQGIFTVTSSANVLTLAAYAGETNINFPVTANHIAVFDDTDGTLGDDAATAINGGNIQAGLSGTAGTLTSFPATSTKGSLKLIAVANTGDTITTISNAAMGQASVISIPDPGASTSTFILANSSGSSQTINSDLIILGGTLQAGISGTAGELVLFSSTSNKGSLIFSPTANQGNTNTTISNSSMAQATSIAIPDPGASAASFLISTIPVDFGGNANLYWFDITVGQAALASAGSVTLKLSSGSAQYKLRSLQLSGVGGTNFSGGGGDRLGQVTDGTTVYSLIPAATMQTLTNAQWGVTALPNPASVAINTSSVAGSSIVFKYSGGTTDYTAGSLVISGMVQRIA